MQGGTGCCGSSQEGYPSHTGGDCQLYFLKNAIAKLRPEGQ